MKPLSYYVDKVIKAESAYRRNPTKDNEDAVADAEENLEGAQDRIESDEQNELDTRD